MIKKSLLVVTYAALMGSAALAVVYNADGPIPSSDYIVSDDEPTDTQRIAPLFGAGQGEARAVMMIRNGIETAKRYAPGYSNQTRFISWSMAKSVTAVLVGEMVADGTLKLDAPVPFAEWQKPGDPRREITLQQMLHMSSGLDHQEGMDPKDGPAGVLKSDTTRILFVQADQPMAAAALKAGLRAKPGTLYDYSSLSSLLLAELMTRQLTDSEDPHVRAAAYKAFAEERLFKPAGITSAFMEFDSAGTCQR